MKSAMLLCSAAAAAGLVSVMLLDGERHAGILKQWKFILSLAVILAVFSPLLRLLSAGTGGLDLAFPDSGANGAAEIWREAETAALNRMESDARRAFPGFSFTLKGYGDAGLESIEVTGDENAGTVALYLETKYGIPCKGKESSR